MSSSFVDTKIIISSALVSALAGAAITAFALTNYAAGKKAESKSMSLGVEPDTSEEGSTDSAKSTSEGDDAKANRTSIPISRQLSMELTVGYDDDDWAVQDARRCQGRIESHVRTLEDSFRVLRRTRAVTIMANRLMLARDEAHCFEEVSRLLVSLFHVERSSFALLTDANHFTLIKCSVVKKDYAKQYWFELEDMGLSVPLKGTAIGYCAGTLEPVYFPDAKLSPFTDHEKITSMGLNTVMNVPILVNGRKFTGCLNMALADVDAFTEYDQILVKDIAATLGTHVYSKRLEKAEADSHQVSRELLHSLIPQKVLSNIEHFWSQNREATTPSTPSTPFNELEEKEGGNAELMQVSAKERFKQIKGKLEMLQKVNRENFDEEELGVIYSRSKGSPYADTPSRALYAEEAHNVSIIFVDIVGFSRISMSIKPIDVMDMLQSLFHRFDELCVKHGILKLDTIGDAYFCSAGMLDGSEDNADGGKGAALRALAMAKEMVREARKVPVPCASNQGKVEYLDIRVGIHVGDVTCGVLGAKLPKFSCFGNAVNMAARMEQTSVPGKIHVSNDFHDLVGEDETEWEQNRVVAVKNMGNVETWLLDPIFARVPRRR